MFCNLFLMFGFRTAKSLYIFVQFKSTGDAHMPKQLPKNGEKIPANKFHISKTNVRYDEPFGDSEEDKLLIHQISLGKKIVEPFKARPEGEGYGIYMGRRRFLASKTAGTKQFTAGEDVVFEDIDEEEARRQSLIENVDFLRKHLDPVKRAENLAKQIDSSPGGLRATAGKLGISPSTLSEWLKILELAPKMQEQVSRGHIAFSEALHLAKQDFGEERQIELAETLETEGAEAFKDKLEAYGDKGLKRGIPKGKYIIYRTTFDRAYPPDMKANEYYEERAKKEHTTVDVVCKNVLLKEAGIKQA